MANDSNFDRNPLRGCNYGLEGGAFLILGGCSSLPKEEERLHNNVLRENNFLLKCVCFSLHPCKPEKMRYNMTRRTEMVIWMVDELGSYRL